MLFLGAVYKTQRIFSRLKNNQWFITSGEDSLLDVAGSHIERQTTVDIKCHIFEDITEKDREKDPTE